MVGAAMQKGKTMRLIDADALKEVLHGTMDWCDLIEVDKAIRDAPTIDPVRRGKWEDKSICDGDAIEEWQEARCSACGLYHTTPYMYYFDEFRYCPSCGARMLIGDEEVD